MVDLLDLDPLVRERASLNDRDVSAEVRHLVRRGLAAAAEEEETLPTAVAPRP
jgi:hypothetical protein